MLAHGFAPVHRTVTPTAGKRIFHYLKTRNIHGETGQVAFDDNGDRIYAEYEVINIRDHQDKKTVGNFYYDSVSGGRTR